MRPRVFINYRREDSAGYALRLYHALGGHFGEESVLMDIGAIGSAQVVERSVELADVVIALIGPQWLQATGREGRRRLEMPDDWVRMEIETALRSDTRVIPTLVQGAQMPSTDELPEPLRALARRNAIELRDGSWRDDVQRLIEALERILPPWTEPMAYLEPAPPPSEQRPRLPRFRRWLEAREQKKAGEEEVSDVEREVEG